MNIAPKGVKKGMTKDTPRSKFKASRTCNRNEHQRKLRAKTHQLNTSTFKWPSISDENTKSEKKFRSTAVDGGDLDDMSLNFHTISSASTSQLTSLCCFGIENIYEDHNHT